MKTITAKGYTVIVEMVQQKDKVSDGGIILKETNDREAQSQAIIISMGCEVKNLKVGDLCIVSRLTGELFELDGRYFRSMEAKDIFAVLS